MNDDVIDDENTINTEREQIDIICRRCDWDMMRKIKRGDKIIRQESRNGKRYAVESSNYDETMGFVIHAREI